VSARDRLVFVVISAVAVFGAVWLLFVSPERKKAAKLQTQVTSAAAQLASAEGQVASARNAQARYAAAYAAIVSLGKAVPADREVPSLLYQLAQASQGKHVELVSVVSGATAASSPSASSAQTAAAPVAGFTQMPFTFTFNGTYEDLYKLFQQLNQYTARTASGTLRVSGRLLTVQGVKLAPTTTATSTASSHGSGKGATQQLTGTVSATAYVLPASQGLTGGATSAAPAGVTAANVSSSAGSPSTPTAPAIARVNP
jgi:Tfp pilus assembly protein PilO